MKKSKAKKANWHDWKCASCGKQNSTLESNEKVWTMKNGNSILIKEMETSHLVHTIAMLDRQFTGVLEVAQISTEDADALGMTPEHVFMSYKGLKDELRKRLNESLFCS